MTDKVQKITQALAEAQLQRNNTAGFIKTLQTELATKDDRIEKLKTDLAEAKKPKFKHLDICMDCMGKCHVVIDRLDAPICVSGPTYLCDDAHPDKVGLSRIGNVLELFANIKVTSEPLEEFEVDRCRFKILSNDYVELWSDTDDGVRRIFLPAEFDKLVDGVRRMQRTLKAKQ